MPQCLPLLSAYRACSTQWRHAGNGMRIGMDYPGVESALRLDFPKATAGQRRRQFGAVRTIERALLEAQRERWESEQHRMEQ